MRTKGGHDRVFIAALTLEATTRSTTSILLWFAKMLQSMIMYVCVRCVYIVTTKCKAVRKTHLDEHDDPETISLFYIFIIYYTYFQAPHHQSELLATRKKFTF